MHVQHVDEGLPPSLTHCRGGRLMHLPWEPGLAAAGKMFSCKMAQKPESPLSSLIPGRRPGEDQSHSMKGLHLAEN